MHEEEVACAAEWKCSFLEIQNTIWFVTNLRHQKQVAATTMDILLHFHSCRRFFLGQLNKHLQITEITNSISQQQLIPSSINPI